MFHLLLEGDEDHGEDDDDDDDGSDDYLKWIFMSCLQWSLQDRVRAP